MSIFYHNLKIINYINYINFMSIIIQKATINRLIHDIKDVKNNIDSEKEGIFYEHDQNDMLLGYALIFGPSDTPYSYGNYLFEFKYPYDYPHSPPTVIYHTNDGCTRFHPNFYKNGKVCLSILNTWKGDQWTGSITLKSILLTLVTLFTKNSLIHEPGINLNNKDVKEYDKIIQYKNIETSIINIINKNILPEKFFIFYEIIKNNFIKNYSKIIDNLSIYTENEYISTNIYNMKIKIKSNKIQTELDSIKKKFNSIKEELT